MRLTCLSMVLCRMRPTAPCFASGDVHCMGASRRLWKHNSRKSLRTSRSWRHVTAPRLVLSRRLRACGHTLSEQQTCRHDTVERRLEFYLRLHQSVEHERTLAQ